MPDFRLNKAFAQWDTLTGWQRDKVEFLCNECCWFGCGDRKRCYEAVSRKNLGESGAEHHCAAPDAEGGYLFSKAMANPGFIGTDAIKISTCPWDFPVQDRGAGTWQCADSGVPALLYDETRVSAARQGKIYLDNMLDLF